MADLLGIALDPAFTAGSPFVYLTATIGTEMQVQRWRSRYRLTVHNEPVARVSTWGNGMRRGLLPSTTYVVSFQPGAGPRLRQVVLGTVIALELLRTKGDRVAGSTG